VGQITFAPEGEWYPAFTPDGTLIGFSHQSPERSDRDRCLAFVPSGGGRINRQVCVRGAREQDSTNTVAAHAVSPGGRIALVTESSGPQQFAPSTRSLVLTRLTGADTGRVVIGLPYVAPDGRIHDSARDLVWTSETTLIYVSLALTYLSGGRGLPPDTIETPLAVIRLDLPPGRAPAFALVSGTDSVTSLAHDPSDGALYVTRRGDTRVYRLDPVTGAQQAVYDFGVVGVARDVQVGAGFVVAVVGGRWDPLDQGGEVWSAALPGGAPQRVPAPRGRWFRHVRLAPGGGRAVAEGFDVTVTMPAPGVQDTVVAQASNLFLLRVP
jgi:hypothetical protein